VGTELARAVVIHLPHTPDAVAAWALLIYHFDMDVRLQAVMQLGQSGANDAETAVKALQTSLTDGSVEVRREAVTALGMIGPPAADALPALQALAHDSDLQIRARATAAVRAIGRNGK
jgi:HEAT repeat protein